MCDRDCLNCPYQDCNCDEMSAEDWAQIKAVEEEYILPKTEKQKKDAARHKLWYARNRERVSAKSRAYYQKNRDAVMSRNAAYRAANREYLRAHNRAYDARNRENLGESGEALRNWRKQHRLSQEALAKSIGVTQTTVSKWELGRVPYDWNVILAAEK